MKYKIHITTEDGELLDTVDIDTTEKNWDTCNTKSVLINEMFDEIYRHIKHNG